MKILLIGPPGVGKGTQSKLICDFYKIEHISTGDILRKHISESTHIGNMIDESHINSGRLVEDELINSLMSEMCANYLSNKSYLLDGYPRTLNQAKFYTNNILGNPSTKYVVIYLTTDREHILDRINHRLVCSECGCVYNIKNISPNVCNTCDRCGNKLTRRADDDINVFKKRLEIYDQFIPDVINYFKKFNVLYEVDALGDISDVFNNIKDIIGESYDLYKE